MTSSGLSGKIVQFELFHDAVDMYESTEGMVVTRELPSRLLLTSFPIVSQSEKFGQKRTNPDNFFAFQ